MMGPEDTKKFEDLINAGKFTWNNYNLLLHKFDLEKIDLEAEYTKVIKKESYCSRRQRDVIPDFLTVRDLLRAYDEKKTTEAALANTNECAEKTE